MHFELIVAFVEDSKTDDIMEAARDAGATGCTLIGGSRYQAAKSVGSNFVYFQRVGTTLACNVLIPLDSQLFGFSAR